MTDRPTPVARVAPSAWNVANALTVLRLLLVPVFGWLLLWGDGDSAAARWWAFVVFAIAMITDRIDGDIARSRGLITDFGKVADPIADKALVTMALVGLSLLAEIPWWITGVILVREWGITAMRFWVIRHGVMAAGRGGKVKTMLQALALGFYVIPRFSLPLTGVLDAIALITLIAALVVTVVTGIDYVNDAFRLRRTSPRALAKKAARAAAREKRREP
ncbi:CDP-diacylglycerol--glycerol-3-phosphate 3-phosphatidyltransferase [Knoellia subterranea]|uniref:CDP-diacylglycerol--glycerol-3-phosphate 3-phosphatidyltransferase n=1 Tax=Knoellia subterranea KCTC 19937 TaxID=1385521 RepID=A0A0A0JTW0_9MICO|nr:CDP-diacylglycerol--glycerol-3-phosphate 3-phosphatidyltransferase [Knoellia subterranea]KGN39106.1 CDP-diacylglycerol--glycerol-3-phosphate 3-phosphatidyl-transferase [Knoellia subterranea KCTC 19937]